MIVELLARLLEREDLSREEAASAMHELMSGIATPAQMAGFLVALRMKGESAEEIAGFAETMRAMATKVTTSRTPLVDTCGTGGDRAGTFNISTTAAFVVAGGGVAVAKHGNRSASSLCGSADVLEKLGVNINATPQQVGRCIGEIGIGFLFARSLHTAMKNVAAVRMELKTRTVFNLLGPLTNPAGACGQVIGVPDARLVEKLASVLAKLGTRRAFVVSGSDGLDEITTTGPTHVAEALNGAVMRYELSPESLGLPVATREDLLGGDAAVNAGILRAVLEGKRGPHRDIVLANAAAAILASGDGPADWLRGIEIAQHSIDSGAALAKLEALVDYSHRAA
ncbi:MAG TPA: anthranilate phosphoribosyltransferase [Candidatus Hydrogenedentes bacterium]|nr:anthranilate phosphoribosyltransferase [Candidatus Hydrogenedentota bacterium]